MTIITIVLCVACFLYHFDELDNHVQTQEQKSTVFYAAALTFFPRVLTIDYAD